MLRPLSTGTILAPPSKPARLRRPALAEGEPEGREREASGPASNRAVPRSAEARAVAGNEKELGARAAPHAGRGFAPPTSGEAEMRPVVVGASGAGRSLTSRRPRASFRTWSTSLIHW